MTSTRFEDAVWLYLLLVAVCIVSPDSSIVMLSLLNTPHPLMMSCVRGISERS